VAATDWVCSRPGPVPLHCNADASPLVPLLPTLEFRPDSFVLLGLYAALALFRRN
jgi:hypothetical protein